MLAQNNAYATIAGSISAATANPLTITVTSGQGARFSPIAAGSNLFFMLALVDEGPNKVEILYCYQHDAGSDTFVCLRAYDGSSADDWSPGDNLIQISDTKSGWADALDTLQLKAYAAAGGTVNALTASIPAPYRTLTDGMELCLKAQGANTGAVSLTLTFDHSSLGGTTYAMASKSVKKENGAALDVGDIPFVGYPIKLRWCAAADTYLLLNPANLKIGRIEMYGGLAAPAGYVACNGAQLAIASYPLLYAVLGTTWGALTNGSGSAGSTHFRVPDLRGRAPLGAGQGNTAEGGGAGNSWGVGTLTGTERVTLSSNEIPAHKHFVASSTGVDGSVPVANNTSQIAVGGWQALVNDSRYILLGISAAADVGLSSATGGGQSHNNITPSAVVNYIMRAA